MAGELTGTARAYTRCGSCGHARQRHRAGGRAGCVQVGWMPFPNNPKAETGAFIQCECQHFTEPPESE